MSSHPKWRIFYLWQLGNVKQKVKLETKFPSIQLENLFFFFFSKRCLQQQLTTLIQTSVGVISDYFLQQDKAEAEAVKICQLWHIYAKFSAQGVRRTALLLHTSVRASLSLPLAVEGTFPSPRHRPEQQNSLKCSTGRFPHPPSTCLWWVQHNHSCSTGQLCSIDKHNHYPTVYLS